MKNIIETEGILRSLEYCRDNFFSPIMVHSNTKFDFVNDDRYINYNIIHIIPAKFINEAHKVELKNIVPVYDIESINCKNYGITNIIFNIDSNNIEKLSEYT